MKEKTENVLVGVMVCGAAVTPFVALFAPLMAIYTFSISMLAGLLAMGNA